MNAFHLLLALGPLSLYLLGLAAINLSGRCWMTNGVRDFVALGLALTGLMVAGPMELFVPSDALAVFGVWTWALLVSFYGACVLFIALLMRPRLIIYNAQPERIHALLAQFVHELDPNATWSGASLLLPNRAVHLQIETFRGMRNVSLLSVGPRQSLDGWAALADRLHAALADERPGANPRGYSLISFALIMIATIVWKVAADPQAIVQQFQEFLRA
jgi:hypothetical protein